MEGKGEWGCSIIACIIIVGIQLLIIEGCSKAAGEIGKEIEVFADAIVKSLEDLGKGLEGLESIGWEMDQEFLAGIYYYNTDQYEKAVEQFSKAADKKSYNNDNNVRNQGQRPSKVAEGNPISKAYLGICYLRGIGIEKNEKKAFEYFKESAEKNIVLGQLFTGICYSGGIGIEKNEEEGMKWLKKAADKDELVRSGLKYLEDGNEDRAAECFKEVEKKDNIKRQGLLGVWLLFTSEDKNSHKEGVHWLTKAAEYGYDESQLILGHCYFKGEGVAKDEVEAAKWYRKAAEQGNCTAQRFLGTCYLSGNGVEKDEAEAVKWLKKAADQGDKDAENKLKQIGK